MVQKAQVPHHLPERHRNSLLKHFYFGQHEKFELFLTAMQFYEINFENVP